MIGWRPWLLVVCVVGACSSSSAPLADGGEADAAGDVPLDDDALVADRPGPDAGGASDVATDVGRDLAAPDQALGDAAGLDGAAGACSCAGGCAAGQRCLQNEFGGLGPAGPVCQPRTGLAVCRPLCAGGCPAERPACVHLTMSAGCCSDAVETVAVCCANANARDVTDCL
jgi:hypothetical protein